MSMLPVRASSLSVMTRSTGVMRLRSSLTFVTLSSSFLPHAVALSASSMAVVKTIFLMAYFL